MGVLAGLLPLVAGQVGLPPTGVRQGQRAQPRTSQTVRPSRSDGGTPGAANVATGGTLPKDRPPQVLRGVVLSPRFGPVANAVVEVRSVWGERRHQVRTDAAGRFGALGGGRLGVSCFVQARAGSLRSVVVGPIPCEGDGSPLRLWLRKTHRLEVTVQSVPGGTPVVGAELSLSFHELGQWALSASVDEQGTATFLGVIRGNHRLRARAPGFLPFEGWVAVPRKGALRVPLVAAAVVQGEVVDSAGRPIAGARVRWDAGSMKGVRSEARGGPVALTAAPPKAPRAIGGLGVVPGPVPPIPGIDADPVGPSPRRSRAVDRFPGIAAETRTDRMGRFTLRGVPPGRRRLVASAAGHAPSPSSWWQVPPGGRLEGVVVRLRPAGRLVGQVRYADDQPASQLLVTIRSPLEPTPRYLLTDERGHFVAEDIVGRVEIVVGSPAQALLRERAVIRAGEEKTVDLVLRARVYRLAVRAVDERGMPLEGVEVVLTDAENRVDGRWAAESGRDGFVRFEALPPPPWRLRAVAPGGGRGEAFVSTVPPEGELRLLVRDPCSARGRFVDELGEAVAGAAIRVALDGGSDRAGAHRDGVTGGSSETSGPDGQFRIPVPCGRSVRIAWSARGLLPAERRIRVEDGETDLGTVRLRFAGRIHGVVRDRFRQAVHDARVRVVGAEGGAGLGGVSTGPDGSFVIVAPVGDVWLEVSHPAAGSNSVGPIRVHRDEDRRGVELRLPERGDVPVSVPERSDGG